MAVSLDCPRGLSRSPSGIIRDEARDRRRCVERSDPGERSICSRLTRSPSRRKQSPSQRVRDEQRASIFRELQGSSGSSGLEHRDSVARGRGDIKANQATKSFVIIYPQ